MSHNSQIALIVFIWWAVNAVILLMRESAEGQMPRKDIFSPLIDYAAFATILSIIQ